MNNWQPAETSPKETRVLLFSGNRIQQRVGKLVTIKGIDYWDTDDEANWEHKEFSHWMPLPDPPQRSDPK